MLAKLVVQVNENIILFYTITYAALKGLNLLAMGIAHRNSFTHIMDSPVRAQYT